MESETAEYIIVDGQDDSDHSSQPDNEVEIRQEVLKWLSPSDYHASSSEYMKHRIAHTPGTGVWISHTKEYSQWHQDGSSGALWIKGVPGSGKSVALAEILTRLLGEGDESSTVLFFFFRHIISTNRTPISLLRDWLAQALSHSRMLLSSLKKYVDEARSLESLSFDELWDTLLASLKYMRRVYCVVDALDEMDATNEAFIERLVALGKQKPSSIKVLMTSRPVPRVETVLRNPSILQIKLEQHKMQQDIETYVNYRFDDTNLSSVGGPKDIRKFRRFLTEILCQNGHGLFIYAKLMSDKVAVALAEGASGAEATTILQSLPGNLEAMYNGMLQEHGERHGVPSTMQLTVLKWATNAARPLRLIELAGAINASLPRDQVNFKQVKETVRASCGPLLEIFEDETVQVIHHSFTEFLFDGSRQHRRQPGGLFQFPVVTPENSHYELAIACMNALVAHGGKYMPEEDHVHSQIMRRLGYNIPKASTDHPFLNYATEYWGYHSAQVNFNDGHLFQLLDGYILPKPREIGSKDLAEKSQDADSDSEDMFGDSHAKSALYPLNIAAENGLSRYVEHLITQGYSKDGDGSGTPPISAAAAKGHLEVIKVLSAHGADLDSDDYKGLKPIHHAAKSNHATVVKFLLENGVMADSPKTREDPGRRCGNARSTTGEQAIKYASESGHVETVLEIIPYAKLEDLERSLHDAAEEAKSKVVRALLEHSKVSPNCKLGGISLLHRAANAADIDTIRILVENGAVDHDETSTLSGDSIGTAYRHDHRSGSALHVAARAFSNPCLDGRGASLSDCVEILDLLIGTGLDLNSTDALGQTPLFKAIENDYWELNLDHSQKYIQELLLRGADASHVDFEGNNIFYRASHRSSLTNEVLELLVQNGARLDHRRKKDGKTPLYLAAEIGQHENMKNMLRLGADPLARDNSGNTIWHAVFSNFSGFDIEDCINALLSYGTVAHLINVPNDAGETCLHLLASKGTLRKQGQQAWSLIIGAGADLEAQNHEGETVLLRFIEARAQLTKKDAHGALDWVLKFGPKIDARDYKGKTVLHHASRMGWSPELLQVLVQSGADHGCIDYEGNTILHEAVSNRVESYKDKTSELVRQLMSWGVSPAVRNNKGQTALHVAMGSPATGWQSSSMKRRSTIALLAGDGRSFVINCKDNEGHTPLHFAAAASEADVWQLLDMGADLKLTNRQGRTALHVACRARQSNIVGMLLDSLHVADAGLINQADSFGRTALHEACTSGRPESVRLLLDAGADVSVNDRTGVTPLKACAEFVREREIWKTLQTGADRNGFVIRDPFRHAHAFNPYGNGRSNNSDISISEVVRLLLDAGNLTGEVRQLLSIPSLFGNDCSAMLRALRRWAVQHKEKIINPNWFETNLDVEPSRSAEFREITHKFNDALWIFERVSQCDDDDLVEEFVNSGLDVTRTNGTGRSVLHALAERGHVGLLKKVGSRANLFDKAPTNEDLDKFASIGTQPILQAACERHLDNMEFIKVLVDELNVDVNAPCHLRIGYGGNYSIVAGKTALHCLASGTEWWHEKAISFLLERGADPNVKDENGITPLHAALMSTKRSSHTSLSAESRVRALLAGGANPNTLDDKGLSCLYNAGSDPQVVRLLLRSGCKILAGSASPLFPAVHLQDLEILRVYLEEGIDCNVPLQRQENKNEKRGSNGPWDCIEYPLLHAALRHHETPAYTFSPDPAKWADVVKILLDHGADPSLRVNEAQQTILHVVCSRYGVIEPFFNKREVNWEITDSQGCTPLLTACVANGKPSLVKQLADHGVNRIATDHEGKNMLHHYIHNGDEASIIDLMASHPDIRALSTQRDRKGLTPIHCSLHALRISVIRALMDEGADILEPDPDGNTALHHLARGFRGNNSDAVKTLFDSCIARGADINCRNKTGQPPLFRYLASDVDCLETSSHQSSLGVFEKADLFARDKSGKTALHVIAGRGNTGREPYRSDNDTVDLFKLFMSFGLDPLAEDDTCMTALDVADVSGNKMILGLFARVTEGTRTTL